jgi:hypothetical protein
MNLRAYRQDRANGCPPWWVWFEPPLWWPGWLRQRTGTFDRAMIRYIREQERRP